MPGLIQAKIDVVGGGVFGLVVAWRLAGAGAVVTLHEPRDIGASASAVAAGMLAPALESLLDPLGAGHFALLNAAQALWPGLLASLGAPEPADRDGGALYRPAGPGQGDALLRRAADIGAPARRLRQAEAAAMAPGLAAGDWLFLSGETRVEPTAVLMALERSFLACGGRRSHERVLVDAERRLATAAGPLTGDRFILAPGADARALAAAAPELAALTPIKGQILHLAGGPRSGPVIRSREVYIAPQPGGAVVGATMEPGLTDRTVTAAALDRLRADAERLIPSIAAVPGRGLAGVRAATPDGLPMIGPSRIDPRIHLAVGARRNGWLLAPLVAEILLAQISGAAPPRLDVDLSPGRFG